jgi:hypothetical protein
MMVWTSRILIGDMDGEWQVLGSEVGQLQDVFYNIPATNPTQQIPNAGPDDPITTIN